jgi:D-beta-D-heptose 7-phosphate kinase/D-beta-D-heptose 1-phosphate adenosyltransferase
VTARGTRSKLLSRAEACRAVRASKRRKERVVFTNGCFDLLHIGHVRSLEQARRLGDRLLVAINTDASVRALKGRGRPLVPVRQRMEVIAALECVDWVIQFREPTPLSAIRALRPDVLAKGGDWPLARIVGRTEVESWGGRVVRLSQVPGVRTRLLIDRAAGGNTAGRVEQGQASGQRQARKTAPPGSRAVRSGPST